MIIREGRATIEIPSESDAGRKAEVFYNPRMKVARDVAVFIANLAKPKKICDCFGGSGIRSIRFALECCPSHGESEHIRYKQHTEHKQYIEQTQRIEHIVICDIKSRAVQLIKKNIHRNIPLCSVLLPHSANSVADTAKNKHSLKIEVKHSDVLDIVKHEKFDFVDIDPFGSPVGFIGAGANALNKNGILAVTATDVSCLSGRYVKACIRKYQARPLRCGFSKEAGIRILIGKCIIEGIKYKKILRPVFCHSSNHFLRAYLSLEKEEADEKTLKNLLSEVGIILFCPKCLKWKIKKINIFGIIADDIETAAADRSARNCRNRKPMENAKKGIQKMQKINEIIQTKNETCCNSLMEWAGPLWIGKLWESKFAKNFNIIKYIHNESAIECAGFYETHDFASKYKINPPKIGEAVEIIKKQGFKASRTHFSPTGIRSNIPFRLFVKLFFSSAPK